MRQPGRKQISPDEIAAIIAAGPETMSMVDMAEVFVNLILNYEMQAEADQLLSIVNKGINGTWNLKIVKGQAPMSPHAAAKRKFN